MLQERRQAVAAFSTSYMGFTWLGFQNYRVLSKIPSEISIELRRKMKWSLAVIVGAGYFVLAES